MKTPTRSFLTRRSALRLMLGGAGSLAVGACRSPRSSVDADGGALVQRPGVHEQVLSSRGLRYTIAIPNSFVADQAASLIVALHFGGTVTPFYGRTFLDALVGPALQELEALIVAPDATGGTWSSAQNEANLLALLDTLQSGYKIDPRRTLLTGYSMGGAGTWYMAARNQKRFAAALPVSARPQTDSADIPWEIPLYVIHSRQDEVVPLGPTETTVNRLKAKGTSVELVVVEGITHFETSRFIVPLKGAVPWIRKVWA